MSARIPSRRLGQSALAAFCSRSTYWICPNRTFTTTLRLRKDGANQTDVKQSTKDLTTIPKDDPLANPFLERYLAEHEHVLNPTQKPSRPEPITGRISAAESTLLKPEYEIPGWEDMLSPEQKADLELQDKKRRKVVEQKREYELHALSLDPAPLARRKFERKLVVQSLAKRGRVTKKINLKRTERESTYKSPFLPTSVKKLGNIMRQISGKTVEEALIQLRFSKKRVARDVLKGLQMARDEAVAARGMGLGSSQAARDAFEAQQEEETKLRHNILEEVAEHEDVQPAIDGVYQPYLADGTRKSSKRGQPKLIEMKDGSKKLVHDPTEMYIDQAWVGRGEHGRSPEFRARGRVNMLTHRTTMFSVLLKEEKTRMRLSEEIQKKRDNRKLWLPLPDRPVTSQRQFCLW